VLATYTALSVICVVPCVRVSLHMNVVCVCVRECECVRPPAAEEPSARVSVPGTTCWPWGNDRGNWMAGSVICVYRCSCVCVCVCVCVLRSLQAFLPFSASWLNHTETQTIGLGHCWQLSAQYLSSMFLVEEAQEWREFFISKR